MSKGPDLRALCELAGRNDRIGFHRDAVGEDGIAKNTAGANGAIRSDARLAQELHAGLEHSVGADDDVRIDKNRFGHLDGDAGIHERGALAAAEYHVGGGKVRARIAAEDFLGIGSDLRQNGLALPRSMRDGVGEIQLAMLVIRPEPRQARPQLIEREGVDAGVDFVDARADRR